MKLNYLHLAPTSPRVVVVDHHDSFTYNLVQLLGQLGARPEVVSENQATLERVFDDDPDGVLLSPGPGGPHAALHSLALLDHPSIGSRVPLLGVCLGHQIIAHHFGARITRARKPMHGKTTRVHHDGTGLYANAPWPLVVARYNSLGLEPATLPACLQLRSTSEAGEVMGVRHCQLDIEGVQFHPESVVSEGGAILIWNWLLRLHSARSRPGSNQPACERATRNRP